MRIWQAGKKREAIHIPSDPIANGTGNALRIGKHVYMLEERPRTTGLYTGIAKLADGREIGYTW